MRVLTLFTTVVLLFACSGRSNPTSSDTPTSAQATSADLANRAEVSIPVEGMSCGACAARLKRGLKAVDGVLDIEVTLHPGAARIGYLPSKTDPPRLVAAINALDFKAGTPSPSPPVR